MANGVSVGSIYAEAELDIAKFSQSAGQLAAEAAGIAGAMALASAGMGAAASAASGLGSAASAAASQGLAGARSAGAQFASGLAAGIQSGRSGVVNAARSVALAAAAAARAALQIHSPSRVTEGFGEYFDQGFARGIRGGRHGIERAVAEALDVAPRARALAANGETALTGSGAAGGIDYERLAAVLRQAPAQVIELDGRAVARVNAENTAGAQNARARDLARRYGTN